MFDESVIVPIAHVLSEKKNVISDYESSTQIKYVNASVRMAPEATGDGWFKQMVTCPRCKWVVPLQVNQQEMVYIPAEKLARDGDLLKVLHKHFVGRLKRRFLLAKAAATLLLVGGAVAAGVIFPWELITIVAALVWAVIGLLYVGTVLVLLIAVYNPFFKMRQGLTEPSRDLLVAPGELDTIDVVFPSWVATVRVIRQVSVLGSEHRLRAGQSGNSWGWSGWSTTTTITGENLWVHNTSYFQHQEDQFFQIGGVQNAGSVFFGPKVGIDGSPRRLRTALLSVLGAILFAMILSLVGAILFDGVRHDSTGFVVETVRALGLWDMFGVLFVAGFPPLAAGWLAYRWRAFFPNCGRAEALAILGLGLIYSVCFWFLWSPWSPWGAVANPDGLLSAGTWSLLWPFLNLLVAGVPMAVISDGVDNDKFIRLCAEVNEGKFTGKAGANQRQ